MRVGLKICGFRRPEDLRHVRDVDIDAIGVVLDAGPTQVEPAVAAEIRDAAADAPFETVVVSGPASARRVAELVAQGFDRVQAVLDASTLAELTSEAPVLPVFFDGDDLLERMRTTLERWTPPPRPPPLRGLCNIDGAGGGGRGRAADPHRAASAARRWPLMLSGGLRADNVRDALRAVRPAAVDVSSYTDVPPGTKSRDRIARFVDAVRSAEHELDLV